MAFLVYWAIGAAQALDDAAQVLGREVSRGDIESATWALAQVGRVMMGADEERATRFMWQATKVFTSYFDRFDIMLSPVLAAPPLKIGQNAVTGIEEIVLRFAGATKVAVAYEDDPESGCRKKLRLRPIYAAL